MAQNHLTEGNFARPSPQRRKPMKGPAASPKSQTLRETFTLMTALLLVTPSAYAQNAPDVNTMPLDQLAGAIAHTIEVGSVRSPDAPLTFDGVTTQGAKVIIHFKVNDPVVFSKLKADSPHAREAMASHMCRDPQKLAPLKRGVSLIYLQELADKSDKIEYTIDAAACNSLPPVTPASASELSQLANQMVNDLQSGAEKAQEAKQGVTLKQAEAKDGVVEQRFVVVVPAFESFYRANIPQTRGVLNGYVCSRFGDSVRRGLRLHLVYEQFETGEKLSEFNFGPSDC